MTSKALVLVLAYGLVAILWVFGSNQLVLWLGLDAAATARLQTAKGWAFVGATTLLLFLLLRQLEFEQRLASGRPDAFAPSPRTVWLPLTLLVALVGGVLALGIAAYREVVPDLADEAGFVRYLGAWMGLLEPDSRRLRVTAAYGELRGRLLSVEESIAAGEGLPYRPARLVLAGGSHWIGNAGAGIFRARATATLGGGGPSTRRTGITAGRSGLRAERRGDPDQRRRQSHHHGQSRLHHGDRYRLGEVRGRNPNVLSSGRHDRDFYQAMWADLEQKDRWQGEIWNRHKNGEIYPEWLGITVLRDPEGRIAHYVGIFNDIGTVETVQNRLGASVQR